MSKDYFDLLDKCSKTKTEYEKMLDKASNQETEYEKMLREAAEKSAKDDEKNSQTYNPNSK